MIKTNYKHPKGGYGRLPLGNVYKCHGFLQRMHKFEKTDFWTFFHKVTQWFVDKWFGNLWQPISIEFIKFQKQFYAILLILVATKHKRT